MRVAEFFKDRQFKNRTEFFHALKDNETVIVDLKKSGSYKSYEKGQGILNIPFAEKIKVDKSRFEPGYIYPFVNSTNWLDSHDDVHANGCYTKTVKEQQGRIYYIDSHLKGASNIIANKWNIETSIENVEWQILGKNIPGTTEALMLKIAEEHVKPPYLELIKNDHELQNSFAMSYVNVVAAINSTDNAFKENKEAFDYQIQFIANKEIAMKNGYFFIVKELAWRGEASLCPIIGGSNSATSVYIPEPSDDTQKHTEPPVGTQIKSLTNLNFF